MPAQTGRTSDKFMLRLPDGMRERVASEALKNKRSMNAEIVARLERTLEAEGCSGLDMPEKVSTSSIAKIVDHTVAALRKQGWKPT